MDLDPQKFDKVKEETEIFFKNLDEVYCPYFKEKIIFNAKGLEHLKFQRKNHARTREDQFTRFKLLKLVVEILPLSHTLQGISQTKGFELVRSNARNEMVLQSIIYYEFVAIVRGYRLRVVVKEVEGGPKYFWSVIPFWKLNKEKWERKMCYGNPESD